MSCFACIDNDELGAVESCGKFLYIRDGGCHFLGCNYLGLGYSVRKISARIQQNNVTCETKTADDVFVVIKVSVQMEVMKCSLIPTTSSHTCISRFRSRS